MPGTRKNPNNDTSLFDNIGWLHVCSDALRAWFIENGRWLDLSAGTTVFRDGDETDGMYGIGTGSLDLEFAPKGVEEMVTLRLIPGDWVGHGSLLPGMPRPFNIVASVDSRLFFVKARALRSLLRQKPEFWPEFYALTINQILGLIAFIGEAQSLAPETRLARQLLKLSLNEETIKLRQSDLAATLGMSKSSVRRALKILTDSGAIRTGYNRLDVLDRTLLESVSQQTI